MAAALEAVSRHVEAGDTLETTLAEVDGELGDLSFRALSASR